MAVPGVADQVDLHVRLPRALHQQLQAEASRDARSLNQMLAIVVQRGLREVQRKRKGASGGTDD